MYNPQSGSFVWSANDHPLPPFAPWDIGHPTLNPSPLHRVSISHYSRHLAYWRTAAFTELYPYICEVNITSATILSSFYCYNQLHSDLDTTNNAAGRLLQHK